MARLAILLTTLVALLAPAAAGAQQSPFAPIPPAAPRPQRAPATTPGSDSTDTSRRIGGTAQTALVVGGIALLFAIGGVIVRDARRRAPVEHHEPDPGAPRAGAEAARARARAKAKAARAQRKRNRR